MPAEASEAMSGSENHSVERRGCTAGSSSEAVSHSCGSSSSRIATGFAGSYFFGWFSATNPTERTRIGGSTAVTGYDLRPRWTRTRRLRSGSTEGRHAPRAHRSATGWGSHSPSARACHGRGRWPGDSEVPVGRMGKSSGSCAECDASTRGTARGVRDAGEGSFELVSKPRCQREGQGLSAMILSESAARCSTWTRGLRIRFEGVDEGAR